MNIQLADFSFTTQQAVRHLRSLYEEMNENKGVATTEAVHISRNLLELIAELHVAVLNSQPKE